MSSYWSLFEGFPECFRRFNICVEPISIPFVMLCWSASQRFLESLENTSFIWFCSCEVSF